MKKVQPGLFFLRLNNKKERFPLQGQIELTYRCNLDCIHCYCKGCEDKDKELTTKEWKEVLDEIQKEGCLSLCLTGGDPLAREDFLEIYSYAKAKGFIITLFTSGYALTEKLIDYFAKSPPHSIEITLNGITQTTYESITQRKGSFPRVMHNIRLLKKKRLHLILKTNCLRQNKDELGRIKKWTEELLGKPAEKKFRFKYGPMIHARLNQDKTPTNFRLSFEELEEIRKQDPDIWKEYQKGLHSDSPDLKRDRGFLYHCNSWDKDFFIDPFGRLKFCMFSDKFSVDLKTTSFKEGFYKVFPQLLNERFKTHSKCRNCRLRPICYYCPARAYLETGNEEGPVPYYCELAEATAEQMTLATNNEESVLQ